MKHWGLLYVTKVLQCMIFVFNFVIILFSAIVENMAEFRPGLCSEAAQQGLMQWLLKRIKVKMLPRNWVNFRIILVDSEI